MSPRLSNAPLCGRSALTTPTCRRRFENSSDGLNEINIGPGGFTGTDSVMGVNVEQAARHPSCIAVAVSVGCWAHRRALIRIHPDMSYEFLSHKGVVL
ncbi:MAG: fumarate hydratase [Sutterella wadsworthensis]